MILTKAEIERFMTEERSARDMVGGAERLGQELANNKLSSSQIRNAYGNMKKIEMQGWDAQTERSLLLLKPRLAYAASRQKAVKELSETIGTAIDYVRDQGSFQRFCQFFEAIVAYHKAFGGK
ncbi:MAG: type III-A CRISPR-associated protein Csm2 [Pseudomonadota bacterium]|nr:type III-A CRISPR-associated protein Csm2 [Pseudomonadota bacterium]